MPRPAYCIVAMALGISGFAGALVSAILGLVFTAQDDSPAWLPYALGMALSEAILSLEFARRAGDVGEPHTTLHKVGSGFSLATILTVAAAAVLMAN